MTESTPSGRARLRDLGITLGRYTTGPHNAITDVAGVRVGHATVEGQRGEHAVARTGVTAIWPRPGNVFHEACLAGHFVLHGAGEMSGLIQVAEWGLLETPILLTNTLSVGAVSHATVQYMGERWPGMGTVHDVIIPVVGECDDSFLNDIAGDHVEARHVYAALDGATDGPVAEGSVGAGTGMITCDLKAGIGTSSRQLPSADGGFTVGVLVMSNFGHLADLRIDGLALGPVLESRTAAAGRRRHNYGSIICVVATDAPLSARQLDRLCKRAALGIGRAGSYAAHGSGEIVVGFSTANAVRRQADRQHFEQALLADHRMNPLYAAAVECTEEAIANALCAAEAVTRADGTVVPALPLDVLRSAWHSSRDVLASLPR